MDRQLLPISYAITADDIPTWGKTLGGIVSALGVRELLAAWQKNKFKREDDKDKLIAELRAKNEELEQKYNHIETEVAALYSAIDVMIQFVEDVGVKAALQKIVDKRNGN